MRKAVDVYPTVGQLLGRLCAMPAILVIPSVYKPLMRCVLSFHSSKPKEALGDGVEYKAKLWAMVSSAKITWNKTVKQNI